MTTFDYSPFVPGKIEPALLDLSKAYEEAVQACNGAYQLIPLPGLSTVAPGTFGARDVVVQSALNDLPAVRDISSYAALIQATLPVLTDKSQVVSTLRPILTTWNRIDVTQLAAQKKQYESVFISYLETKLDPTTLQLEKLRDEIKSATSSNQPASFQDSLFDNLFPILSTITNIQQGIKGQAIIAGMLSLSLNVVTEPLSKVLSPLQMTIHPHLKDSIVSAIDTALVKPLQSYHDQIATVSALFKPYALACVSASGEQAATITRIDDTDPVTPPITMEQCISAWAGAQKAADRFIQLVAAGDAAVGPTVSLMTSPISVTRTSPTDELSSKLSPPSYASELLPTLATTDRQVSASLTNLLTLPFTDALKAADDQTSVAQTIITCQSKYSSVQLKTADAVRQLYSYSILQETIIPAIGVKDGLSFDDFVKTNMGLLEIYKQTGIQVADATDSLLADLKDCSTLVSSNINAIDTSLKKAQTELDAAQQAYDAAKASSLIMEILSAAYTGAALAALAAGDGSLALDLGMKAHDTFTNSISEFVNAGELSKVISNLKQVIQTSSNTRNQLALVVPLFNQVAVLVDRMRDIWGDTSDDLEAARKIWNANPGSLTPDMIQVIVGTWKSLSEVCMTYLKTGRAPSAATKLLAPFVSSFSQKIATEPQIQALISPSTPADRVIKFRALASAQNSDEILNALSAPKFDLGGLNRGKLRSAASTYNGVGDALKGLYTDSSQDAYALARTINNTLIPSLSTAINFFNDFAIDEKKTLDSDLTTDKLQEWLRDRETKVDQGNTLQKAAETDFINFRNASQNAYNRITAHVGELEMQLSAKEASLADLQREYEKWSWLAYLPGVGQIIYLIVNSITNTTSEIASLKRQINSIREVRSDVQSVQAISEQVGRMTSGLSQSWSDMTTKTQTLKLLLHTSADLPANWQTMKPIVELSWDALSASLAEW
ncbi:hypothetical protein WOLCODRAFT_28176 [Wolfiporia cocos MD-104 SS10]|uniref:Uncharacterized protein n=1 Tax=Wolfiporia cocos (strain MD-104) TaxID=742152 RepID=A0A2H3J7U1_WOLCO|nr:hypothetical protein WOLCODRAFT_28176 [Wolfiporia cocos MD-104 SS10]